MIESPPPRLETPVIESPPPRLEAPVIESPAPGRGARARQAVRQVWGKLRGGELTPARAAMSVALGVFVGCVPAYGLQTWLCLALALPLRLNYPLAYLATWIANPLTIAFIVMAEIKIGAFIMTGRVPGLSFSEIRASGIGNALGHAMLGGVVVGVVLGIVSAGIAYVWARGLGRARAPEARG